MNDLVDPVLILSRSDTRSDDPNRFAGYLAEMLRLEGLNGVAVRDLAVAPLRAGEVLPPLVLAAAVPVDEPGAAVLVDHVHGGGSLLAARPGQALAAALGLRRQDALADGWAGRYVLLEETSPVVADLPWTDGGVQFQSAAASYLPTAEPPWSVAAWLAPYPGQRTRFPALLAGTLGAGRAAVFAFDPAGSALRQQQGRPEQASTGALPDFDGDTTFRPNDLFLGQLDPARRDVPQADLQRTLLLRAVEWLSEPWPLPRLWRFPGRAAAAALLDGDSDGMTLEDFRLAIATCDRYGAPFAMYLKTEHVALLGAGEVRAARERGHSFGPHPWASPRPTPAELRAALEANCALFAEQYGYRPRVHRGHWLIWPGWVDHARSLAQAGIRLDASFTCGRNFQGGYVNGTGLPVRFVSEDGAVLRVSEQSTIATDDGWLSGKTGLPAHTLASAITRCYAQIDAAADRYHTVFHPYFHPVLLEKSRALPYPTLPWLEAVLAHCRRRDLLFLDAERWVDWNDARRQVRFGGLAYGRGGCSVELTLHAPAAVDDLTVLLPLPAGAGEPTVLLDGAPPNDAPTMERHGRRYAAATLSVRTGEERKVEVRWE